MLKASYLWLLLLFREQGDHWQNSYKINKKQLNNCLFFWYFIIPTSSFFPLNRRGKRFMTRMFLDIFTIPQILEDLIDLFSKRCGCARKRLASHQRACGCDKTPFLMSSIWVSHWSITLCLEFGRWKRFSLCVCENVQLYACFSENKNMNINILI